MSVEKAKKVLDTVGAGLHALEAIGKLANGVLAKGRNMDSPRGAIAYDALGALSSIAAITDAMRGALDGSVSLEEIEAEIKRLSSDLAMNDAQVKSDIDAKFGDR